MITQKLKRAVVKEALLLRKFASRKEKNKIDIGLLNPFNSEKCIYGRLTGSCFSKRACELLKKCAVKYSDSLENHIPPVHSVYGRLGTSDYSFSAIEHYITQPNAKISDLIGLIKS